MNKNPKKNQEATNTISETAQKRKSNLKKIAITGATAAVVSSAVAFTLAQENNKPAQNKTMKATGKNAIHFVGDSRNVLDLSLYDEVTRLFGGAGAKGLFNDQTWLQKFFSTNYGTNWGNTGILDFIKNNFSTDAQKAQFYGRLFNYCKADYFKTSGYNADTGVGRWPGDDSGPINDDTPSRNYRPLANATFDFVSSSGALNEKIEPWAKKIKLRVTSKLASNDGRHPNAVLVNAEEYVINWPKSEVDLAWDEISTGGTNIFWPHDSKTPSYIANGGYESTYQDWQWDEQSTDVWWFKIDFNKTFTDKYINNGRSKPTVKIVSYKYDNPTKALTDSTGDNQVVVPGKIKLQFGEALSGDYSVVYREIPTTVTFKWVNKQSQYVALNNLISPTNSFTIAGDKWSSKITNSNPTAAAKAIWDAKNFRALKFGFGTATTSPTTWTDLIDFTKYTSQTAVETALTDGIPIPNGSLTTSGAELYIKNQENNVPDHFKYTSAAVQETHFAPIFQATAIDVLALVTNITTAIALSGKSKAPTVSFNLTTYQGLKVELKIGTDTTWRDATAATAYYASKNIYNGTSFDDVTFTYKISNTTSGGKVYKSDDAITGSSDDYQGTATFKTDNLKKVLVKAMNPASSWVFMSDADTFAKFRIWEPGALAAGTPVPSSTTNPMPPTSVVNGTNAPADTKFAYTLYYKAANGHKAGDAFDNGGSTEMTMDQLISTVVAHNLYNETNGDWEFDKITVKLAPKDPANYEMDDAHETELWNSNSTKLAKSIDFLQANTTDKVKIDVSATSTTNKSNALVIDDSQVSNQTGIKYLYAFDSSGASTWYSKADMEAEIQKNLWDNTKGTSGDWKYNTIWVRIAPFDNTWVVRNQNAKEIWNSSTAGTKKIITTTAITATSFGGLNGAAANTKAFTLPTITAPRNSHVVYTVMSNATTPVELKAGDRATVQAWLDAGYNLWDSTNNAFKVSSIKVKFVADNAGFELSDARNTTLWDTSSTKLLKYIEPSSTNTVDQLKVSGATNAITITEPTIATGAGYHIEYEFGGTDARLPQGFKKYTDLTSFLTTTNLWDQSATTPGFIFTTLKAKIVADDTTNSLLSNEHLTTLWTATDTLGTGKTNNFLDATVKKYVDPSALKTALLGSALTASGPNDANITWGGKSTIVAQAAGLNVKLSYAFSDNDTTPPTTWGGEFKDIPSAWNPAGVKAAKKRLWMKIEPLNDSFTVSSTNQAAFKANVDMNPFKLNYTITQNDIDAVKLNPTTSSSLNIALSTPTREEFDYQFGIVKKGATDVANGDWKSYADFLTEVATLDPIEGIWDSTTNSYRISKIQMKLVNKPSGDYTLATSALIPRTIFDATSPNIWNGTSIASTPLKRMIDTSTVKADLKAGVIPDNTSTNDAVDWTGAKAKVKLITDRGIKVEFLLSESVLTQGALPGATGWSINLPTTLNEDSAKRYLYARIAPNTSTDDISTAANDRYLDLSTDSKIKDVATLIDTSTYVIDQDLIAGDTHHLTGSTTFKPASVSGLSAIKQQGFDIVYTLTNWANPGANDFTNLGLTQGTHTLKAAMTETELKALFDGTKGNLYKWGTGTSTTNSLKAKFIAKTGFKVSNAKETSLSLNHTATFKWYYDVQALIDSLKGTSAIKTDQILPLGTSRNDDIHWTNNPTTTTLRYNNEVDRIEYLSGDYSSPAQVSAAPANKWTTTLPTSIDYTHSKRNIYARIISKDGYVASNLAAGATDPTPIDLTTTSKIREVITSISDSADYAAFDISKIAFTSTTNSAAIDETPAGAAPVGSKISYQVQYYGAGNVATTSAWMDKASFITFIKNNHVLVRTIKAHLETNDATRYEVATGKDKINTCDISNFYYFNSMVNSGKTIVSSLLTKANIDIRGILSKDNGVQVKIPTALKETELAKIGLALQYSVNDGPYKNFSAATTDFTAGVSDPNGHQSASAGEYMLVKVDDLGPNKTWLRFRIIPIYQDDYTTKTTVTDENDWQKIIDDVKVKTSDIFNNSAPTVYSEDLTTLPVLVSTSNTWITAGNLNITGTSRNLAINSYTISDIGTDLDRVNSSKGYSTKIELGFRVEDGNIPANIYFKRNDFMTWLSGAAPAALSVYDASTNTMVALNTVGVTTKGSTNNDIYRKPHWNAINLDTFKARFISTDGGYRVSDSVEVALPTHTTQAGKEVYTVKKWTDLQAYLDRLKAADISGDTAHLKTTTLTAVQADLDKDFGVKDGFKIQSTPVIANGVGDWTSAKVKDAALPDEIKFTYDLAFRIIPVEDQFEASVEPAANATPATNVDVIWDKHTSTNVKKFLHIDTDKLSTIIFDGTTKNLTTNIASLLGLLLADDNGVMIQASTNRGVEIQARLKDVTGSKIHAKNMDSWTELNQFILNLNDTKNVDLFDGTWGRDQIEIKYAVKAGFAADNAELQQIITPSATAIANVKRYINIDSLVTTATQNKQTGIIALSKTLNEGWWNALSSAYDDHKNWTGYIDNKNFDLKTLTIPSDLHVKVQYTIDNGQNWTDTIPTVLADDANTRNLSIRFAKSSDYGTEDVVTSDMTNTNSTWVPKSHDITSNSGIKNIPTRIDATNVHLENIKFTGDTRHLVEDTSTAGIPASARVEYSLTDFVRLNSTNSTLATQAQAVLANIGITNASHPDLYAKYTGSLTFNELKTFINAIVDKNDPTLKEILRSSISARLVANNTYSLTQTDDTNTRKAINVSGLYTFKDITKDVDFLKLATPTGTQNGINIYGTQNDDLGALIQIPDALITSLAANNLKLQFTTDGKRDGTNYTTILGDSPTWADVSTQHFASGEKPGSPDMDHGFKLTLKTIVSDPNSKKGSSYIAFRIVPTKNDAGTDSTVAVNAALTEHYDKTNTKLFTVSGTGINAQPTLQATNYDIDTTQIPTVIKVTGIDLSTITASGNTKDLSITEAAKSLVDGQNTDQSLDDNLQLLYALDKTNADAISSFNERNDTDLLWLTETDFEAYWQGNLVVSGGKVIHKGTTEEVEAFKPAVIAARKLKDGDAVLPNYLATSLYDSANKKNLLLVKWVSMSKDYDPIKTYIPSDTEAYPVSYSNQTFKKWFDGSRFNTAIEAATVTGTTKQYDIHYNGPATILQGLETSNLLKFQYSTNGTTWSDSKIDFTTLTWQEQVDHKIYIRVVPKSFTGTTAITGASAVAESVADGIIIDYKNDRVAGKLIKIDEVKANSTEKEFKTYLDINSSELANIKAKGNSWALLTDAQGAIDSLNETTIDNNTAKYSQVEIQYLFNNVWYNKADLVAEMKRIRDDVTDADKAKAYVAPTDFTHQQIKARWRVLDPVNFVIASEQTDGANKISNLQNVDSTAFKTFINVWNIQDKLLNDFKADLGTQAELFDLMANSGTTVTLSGNIKAQQKLPASLFSQLNVKLQYSTAATPNDAVNSTDWFDAEFINNPASYPAIIKDAPFGVGKNLPLWFRIVPKDASESTVSTAKDDGNSAEIQRIKMDTSKLKFTIKTDSDALLQLKTSGDTQDNFTSDETPFTSAHKDASNNWVVDGIGIYVTDPTTSAKVPNPTDSQINSWLTSMGLRINYRVIPNRTAGKFIAGQAVEFTTLAELQKELKLHNLNFDRSTLNVRWDFADTQFVASDPKWITPADLQSIVNIIYTEDIFTLQPDTLLVTGNNLKVQSPVISTQQDSVIKKPTFANVVLEPSSLQKDWHVKLQYNWAPDKTDPSKPDAAQWSDTPPTQLNGARDYWIRYEVVDSTDVHINSLLYPSNPSQITKVNVSKIKQAVSFNITKIDDIKLAIKEAKLAGYTIDFTWDKALPAIQTSLDGHTHGHIQYSIDGNTYSDTMADALASSDYYQMGVLGFIKERGDKLYVRYVYEGTVGNMLAKDSNDYVFTNTTGDELKLDDLLGTIDIDNLIEPVWIDKSIGLLSNQQHITAQGLSSPNGNSEFADVTWRNLADFGLFKPSFVAAIVDGKADFRYMWYDGVLKDNSQNYIFGLGKNPFDPTSNDFTDPKAKDYRTDLRGLLPRHTHLEFRTSSDGGATWSKWSETAPTNITKSSNAKTFDVRLVADQGYTLGETNATSGDLGDFNISDKFPDGSARTAKVVAAQTWSKQYNVTVELLTSDYHLPTDSNSQATFIGWDEDTTDPTKPKAGSGTFATTNTEGNHTPSMDANNLKNILVHFLGANDVPLDFENSERGFVIEWNVTNSGNNIQWTDSRGDKAAGWHLSAPATSTNAHPAPDSSVPWYGAYPVSLKNGDVVQVRLRARDGFIISKDDKAIDYDVNKKESNYSHMMQFAPITTLTHRITIPNTFALYDVDHSWDYEGKDVQPDTSMPKITFSGSQGAGKLAITGGKVNPHYHYEVAILRSMVFLNGGTEPFTSEQKPYLGYCVESYEDQMTLKQQTVVYDAKQGWRTGWKSLLETQQMWKKPADINDLNVGDAVLVRLVADAGYGFEWENQTNNFADTNYPKDKTYDFYGTKVSSTTEADTANNFNINAEQIDNTAHLYPSIVRGLKVMPTIDLAKVSLEYSTVAIERLNNGKSVIKFSQVPASDENFKWRFKHNGGVEEDYDPVLGMRGYVNGDTIEFWAVAKNKSFELDKNFNNNHITLTIDQLKDATDIAGVERPVLTIGEYDGKGTIMSIVPEGSKQGQKASRWAVPDQTNLLGTPLMANEVTPGTLKWQYQVIHENPLQFSDRQLEKYSWTDAIPTDLKYGDWVRMKVATVDPAGIALANGTDYVYSFNPASQAGATPVQASWFEVKDLFIDTRNNQIDYGIDISGYIRRSGVQALELSKADEMDYGDIQFQIIHKDAITGNLKTSEWVGKDGVDHTVTLQNGQSPNLLQNVENGDVINWRVIPHEGYTFNTNDPEIKQPEDVKTWNGNGFTTKKMPFLQRSHWTYTVSGLKYYLNTDGVEYTPNIFDGTFDFRTMIVDQTGAALGEIDAATKAFVQKTKISDGNAKIKAVDLDKTDTIKDVDGKSTVKIGTKDVEVKDIVKVRYIVKSVDPYTGQQMPEFTVNSPDVPSKLSTGDEITIELYSTEKEYQLSSFKRITFKVTGLTTDVNDPVTDPIITFTGESLPYDADYNPKNSNYWNPSSPTYKDNLPPRVGGSLIVSPQAPLRTKWVYSVIREPELQAQNLQVPNPIDELKNPDDHTNHPIDPDDKWLKDPKNKFNYYWTSKVPTDLSNGDFVSAMLIVAVEGSTGININHNVTTDSAGNLIHPDQIPMSNEWVKVEGLAEKIDLSKYTFKLIDSDNPVDPNKDNGFRTDDPATQENEARDFGSKINFAFKVAGTQDGQAELLQNALIQSTDLTELLVDQNGEPLPAHIRDYLQWEFAVNADPLANGRNFSWTTTLPKSLKNGQYIHVRLVGKPNLVSEKGNIEIYGYNPQVFMISGLETQPSVANKMVTLVAAVAGGVAALGASSGALLFLRRRKKKFHFSD